MKVVTIGRSSDNNNIIINDGRVSRSHLQIILDDSGCYYAIDLDSTNGTFVNGKRISGKTPLQKGDTIVIGNTTLPWETYFTNESNASCSKNSNNRKVYVVIGIVLLICVIIGIIYAVSYNNKKSEEEKNRIENQYRDAQVKSANASADYSDRKRAEAEANEQKAKDAQAVAEKKAKDAKDAQARAEENEKVAKDAQEEAEKKEQVANAAKEEAEKKAEAALKEAGMKEQVAKEAQAAAEKAKENEEVAKNAQKTAEETTRLTIEFYKLLSTMKDAQIETVCKKIGLKTHTEDKLKNAFNSEKTTNERREKIIKTIKDVLNPSTQSTHAADNSQKSDTTAVQTSANGK